MAAGQSETANRGGQRRFVVLRHEVPPGQARPSHWDWMFEVAHNLPLLTWALETLPDGGQPVRGALLAPHRRLYLDYEGEISEGRGTVQQWDCGTYEFFGGTEDALAACLDQGGLAPVAWRFQLHGVRLRGELTLTHADAADQFWLFSFRGNIAVR